MGRGSEEVSLRRQPLGTDLNDAKRGQRARGAERSLQGSSHREDTGLSLEQQGEEMAKARALETSSRGLGGGGSCQVSEAMGKSLNFI